MTPATVSAAEDDTPATLINGDRLSLPELHAQFSGWLEAHTLELERFLIQPESCEDSIAQEQALLRLLWDAGWSRIGWPTECGGLGGGVLHRGVFYDTLMRSGIPLPQTMPVVETLGNTMLHFAPDLAATELRRFIRGDTLWCQGFSEPEAGSDLGSLRTAAQQTTGGFMVSGQKIWTTLGHLADYCAVLVRTGEPGSAYRGLSLLFADMRTPGVEARPIRAVSGRNEFAELFFDGVHVPLSGLIGTVNEGWTAAMYALQWERGMYAWQQQSWMHCRLDELVKIARTWPDGGRSLAGAFARVHVQLTEVRLKARETVRALAEGVNPGPRISVDKLLLATAEQELFNLGRCVLASELELGTTQSDLEWRRDFLYSRAATVFGGSADIQRNIVAERLLNLPREARGG